MDVPRSHASFPVSPLSCSLTVPSIDDRDTRDLRIYSVVTYSCAVLRTVKSNTDHSCWSHSKAHRYLVRTHIRRDLIEETQSAVNTTSDCRFDTLWCSCVSEAQLSNKLLSKKGTSHDISLLFGTAALPGVLHSNERSPNMKSSRTGITCKEKDAIPSFKIHMTKERSAHNVKQECWL